MIQVQDTAGRTVQVGDTLCTFSRHASSMWMAKSKVVKIEEKRVVVRRLDSKKLASLSVVVPFSNPGSPGRLLYAVSEDAIVREAMVRALLPATTPS